MSSKNRWLFSFIPVVCLLFLFFLLKIKDRFTVTNWLPEKREISTFCINDNCFRQTKDMWMFGVGESMQPADSEAISDFLKQVATLKLTNIASSNEKRFEQLGVTDKSPKIKVLDKTLLVGSLGPNFETTYVKPLNENNIYEVPTIWGNAQLTKNDFWRVKYVANTSIYQLKSVEVSDGSKNKTIKPVDGKWEQEDKISVAAYLKVEGFLGQTEPKSKVSTMDVKLVTEEGEINYRVGNSLENKLSTYWVGRDNLYYKISEKDFSTLTSLL